MKPFYHCISPQCIGMISSVIQATVSSSKLSAGRVHPGTMVGLQNIVEPNLGNLFLRQPWGALNGVPKAVMSFGGWGM